MLSQINYLVSILDPQLPSYTICVYVAVHDDLLALDAKVAETIASAWASSTLAVRNSQGKNFSVFVINIT